MSEDYYSHSRPEVRALVPRTARVIVDVGCGAGAVGAALKEDIPGAEVRGIEQHLEAAAEAARRLDDVAVLSAEGGMPASWPAPDCVIFADVLEHLVDPWTTFRRWCAGLRPGAVVVVSLPNVGHHSVTIPLWKGRWDYGKEGLLDRTHLRFFTRQTSLDLFQESGLQVEHMQRAILLPGGFLGQEILGRIVQGGLDRERLGGRVPTWLMRVLDSCSRQFLFRARSKGSGLPVGGELRE